MKTTQTIKQALNDPTSSIHAKLANATAVMADNRAVIDTLMAQGMTREQAWAEALKR